MTPRPDLEAIRARAEDFASAPPYGLNRQGIRTYMYEEAPDDVSALLDYVARLETTLQDVMAIGQPACQFVDAVKHEIWAGTLSTAYWPEVVMAAYTKAVGRRP